MFSRSPWSSASAAAMSCWSSVSYSPSCWSNTCCRTVETPEGSSKSFCRRTTVFRHSRLVTSHQHLPGAYQRHYVGRPSRHRRRQRCKSCLASLDMYWLHVWPLEGWSSNPPRCPTKMGKSNDIHTCSASIFDDGQQHNNIKTAIFTSCVRARAPLGTSGRCSSCLPARARSETAAPSPSFWQPEQGRAHCSTGRAENATDPSQRFSIAGHLQQTSRRLSRRTPTIARATRASSRSIIPESYASAVACAPPAP